MPSLVDVTTIPTSDESTNLEKWSSKTRNFSYKLSAQMQIPLEEWVCNRDINVFVKLVLYTANNFEYPEHSKPDSAPEITHDGNSPKASDLSRIQLVRNSIHAQWYRRPQYPDRTTPKPEPSMYYNPPICISGLIDDKFSGFFPFFDELISLKYEGIFGAGLGNDEYWIFSFLFHGNSKHFVNCIWL